MLQIGTIYSRRRIPRCNDHEPKQSTQPASSSCVCALLADVLHAMYAKWIGRHDLNDHRRRPSAVGAVLAAKLASLLGSALELNRPTLIANALAPALRIGSHGPASETAMVDMYLDPASETAMVEMYLEEPFLHRVGRRNRMPYNEVRDTVR